MIPMTKICNLPIRLIMWKICVRRLVIPSRVSRENLVLTLGLLLSADVPSSVLELETAYTLYCLRCYRPIVTVPVSNEERSFTK